MKAHSGEKLSLVGEVAHSHLAAGLWPSVKEQPLLNVLNI